MFYQREESGADLLELLVRQTVELDDELAVRGGDLGARVDDLDDVQLLPQAHLHTHLPAEELNVLHLDGHTDTWTHTHVTGIAPIPLTLLSTVLGSALLRRESGLTCNRKVVSSIPGSS